MLSSYYSNLPQ
jgi:hypothetical protein